MANEDGRQSDAHRTARFRFVMAAYMRPLTLPGDPFMHPVPAAQGVGSGAGARRAERTRGGRRAERAGGAARGERT